MRKDARQSPSSGWKQPVLEQIARQRGQGQSFERIAAAASPAQGECLSPAQVERAWWQMARRRYSPAGLIAALLLAAPAVAQEPEPFADWRRMVFPGQSLVVLEQLNGGRLLHVNIDGGSYGRAISDRTRAQGRDAPSKMDLDTFQHLQDRSYQWGFHGQDGYTRDAGGRQSTAGTGTPGNSRETSGDY